MLNFSFDKAFYIEREVLKRLPIPRSTFYRWQSEWISKGKDPKQMGKILVKGTSTVFWNGPVLLNWLIDNKFNFDATYNYDKADKKEALLVINNLIEKNYDKDNN
jgi:hypothetical protein